MTFGDKPLTEIDVDIYCPDNSTDIPARLRITDDVLEIWGNYGFSSSL